MNSSIRTAAWFGEMLTLGAKSCSVSLYQDFPSQLTLSSHCRLTPATTVAYNSPRKPRTTCPAMDYVPVLNIVPLAR